jgi:Fe-S cluster assembly iron-binding protein IscA
MLEVTDKANEMIKDFLQGREEPHSIRIVMSAG